MDGAGGRVFLYDRTLTDIVDSVVGTRASSQLFFCQRSKLVGYGTGRR